MNGHVDPDHDPAQETVTASSLIVVSNRLPFVLQKDDCGNLSRKSSAGGLVTAVAPVVVQSGGTFQNLFLPVFPLVSNKRRAWLFASRCRQNTTSLHFDF